MAAGDGNFAMVAAKEGASVVASDLSPGMVGRGRRRAETEGVGIDWVEADAEELPFEDERFDCVGSVFGAFLAPRPDVVASELVRVTRPGGTVGMTTWSPEGYQAELFELNNRYLPRPEWVAPAIDWGREDVVRERLAGLSVEIQQRTLEISFATHEEMARALAVAPPQVAAQQALGDERFAAYRNEFFGLVDRFNQASDGSVRIPSGYLVIVAHKRG